MWYRNRPGWSTGTPPPGAWLLLVALLAACSSGQDDEPEPGTSEQKWTRAALERNPRLEVVAEDRKAGIFTIRDRRSGELRTVAASELAAIPVSDLLATAVDREAAAAEPPHQPTEAESLPPAIPPAEPVAGPPAAVTGEAAQPDGSTPVTTPTYTIEREGGRVRVSGPGVSIVSGEPSAAGSSAESGETGTAEPVICEGRRLLHIDGRKFSVQGDAVIARGGCELHITNSRIVATGIGVAAHDATVHVTNSYVEGAAGSLEASGLARIFVRSTTLEGLSRRLDEAEIRDLGGNDWR